MDFQVSASVNIKKCMHKLVLILTHSPQRKKQKKQKTSFCLVYSSFIDNMLSYIHDYFQPIAFLIQTSNRYSEFKKSALWEY